MSDRIHHSGGAGHLTGGQPRYLSFSIAAVLVTATVLVYIRGYGNGFVSLDDPTFITENHYVRGGLSWEGLKWAFTELYVDHWHPLTWLSNMLDVQLFGMWAGGHHLVSMGLHVLNTLMLLAFLRYTTGRTWASAFVAGLFALHPLHVESVAWAAERKDVLSTFFWMATMLAYARYTQAPSVWRYLLIVALFGLGLLAKPMLVTLPVILLLLDHWPLGRFGIEGAMPRPVKGVTFRWLLVEKIPLSAMAVAAAVLAVMSQQKTGMSGLEAVSISSRVANAIVSYGLYILQMVWPAGLAAFYPYPHKTLYLPAALWLTFLAVVTVWALRSCRKRRYLLVGWLWFLITLLPVIGLIQVGGQARADRYTYVPLIGLFIIVTWAAADILAWRPKLRLAASVAAALVLLACGAASWVQVGYWHDTVTLYNRTIAVTKNNQRIITLLSDELIRQGDAPGAMSLLQKACHDAPDDPVLMCCLGASIASQGRLEEALDWFRKAVRIAPGMEDTQYCMGRALVDLNRSAEAEQHLRKAIELGFHNPQPYAYLGLALFNTARPREALDACRTALSFDQDNYMAHLVAARILLADNRIEKAAGELAACNRLEPTASTLAEYGSCMLYLKKPSEAETSFRDAIRLAPDSAAAHTGLGVALSMLGRKEDALAQLREALTLDPNYAQASDCYRQFTGQ